VNERDYACTPPLGLRGVQQGKVTSTSFICAVKLYSTRCSDLKKMQTVIKQIKLSVSLFLLGIA